MKRPFEGLILYYPTTSSETHRLHFPLLLLLSKTTATLFTDNWINIYLWLTSFLFLKNPPSGNMTRQRRFFGKKTSFKCALSSSSVLSRLSLPWLHKKSLFSVVHQNWWKQYHEMSPACVLTAKMKKSSCNHETTPKFVHLKTLSMIHMTLSEPRLDHPSCPVELNMVMHSGTSAVDWWFGMNRNLTGVAK